jgi:hypothetical protein
MGSTSVARTLGVACLAVAALFGVVALGMGVRALGAGAGGLVPQFRATALTALAFALAGLALLRVGADTTGHGAADDGWL